MKGEIVKRGVLKLLLRSRVEIQLSAVSCTVSYYCTPLISLPLFNFSSL